MAADIRDVGRPRLDEFLVARGFFPTRSRARDAIARGTVTVDGRRADKPGRAVAPDAAIAIDDPASRYVSRAALKLVAGLDRFGFDPAGRHALDLGASTGGFTQVLLERGAASVTAVDVGHGQFDGALLADPGVRLVERLNARDLDAAHLAEPVTFLVADLSFISLRLALPPALALSARGACAVLLVKPQFEVGREGLGKGGIVRDPARGFAAAQAVSEWLGSQEGWRVLGLEPAPVEGGDGNREYLLGAEKAA